MTIARCVLLYATSAVGDGVPCVPLMCPRLGFTPLALSQRSTVCSDRRKLSCCNQNPGRTLSTFTAVSDLASFGGGGFPFPHLQKTRGSDSLPTGCKGQEGSPYITLTGVGVAGAAVHEPELWLSLLDFLLLSGFSPFFFSLFRRWFQYNVVSVWSCRV